MSKRGSILLIALWSLFLLASFAVILGTQMRQKLEMVKRLGDRESLVAACDASVRLVRDMLTDQKSKAVESSRPYAVVLRASNPKFKAVALRDCVATISYETTGPEGEPLTVYGLIDEESKVNVNKAPAPVLDRLFRLAGLEEGPAQDLAYSIVDWRDADSFLSVPVGSAEDSYYRGRKYPYEAKDADFEVIDELRLVKGVDENVFNKIKNYITIYGTGLVNINTAQRPVLIALGLSGDTADLIISHRNGKDGLAGTDDDNVFRSAGSLTVDLSAAYHLNDAELSELSGLVARGMIDVQSDNFSVSVTARMRRGKGSHYASAVINSDGGILYWSELQ